MKGPGPSILATSDLPKVEEYSCQNTENLYCTLCLSQVKPARDERRYIDTPVPSLSSSTVNLWTASMDSFDLPVSSTRIHVIPYERDHQMRPEVPKQRVDRSTSISSSMGGAAGLIVQKPCCPGNFLMVLGILTTLAALATLAVNIYLFTRLTATTKTCTSAGA